MKRLLPILNSGFVALLLDVPLVAVLAFGTIAIGTSFPAFNLFDVVSRLLPGEIIISTIELMVKVIRALNLGPTDTAAKTAERLMAVVLFTVVLGITSLIFFALARRQVDRSRRSQIIMGIVFAAVVLVVIILLAGQDSTITVTPLLNASWLSLIFLIWGLAHGITQARLTNLPLQPNTANTSSGAASDAVQAAIATQQGLSRRQFLLELGGASAVITLIGAGLDLSLTKPLASASPIAATEAASADSSGVLPAPGTRPEYTPLAHHYRIDINAGSGPHLDESTYKLDISGLVDNPVQLSLTDLRTQFKSMDQIITMSCISNPVAGDLISTIRWTGLSMQDLVSLVKPQPEATYIRLTAADGFSEVVGLDVIRNDARVMLSYAWDGQPLTQEHGFPLRIHIPDRYGMKQPKWITKMEFISQWEPGYWVERGWDREARVRATAVIDTVAKDQLIQQNGQQLVPIGGIAWAGARGISKVEVKVDNGDWTPAQLRNPLSDKAWVIWRYNWPFQAGNHSFAVRSFEKDGTPQIDTVADTFPSGATGIHSVTSNL